MQLKWIKCFPYFLDHTDEGIPEGRGGTTGGLTVRIRPKYKDDEGIHRHEAEHIRQRYMTLGFHNIIKDLSKTYAIWTEVSAYREQLKHPPALTGGVDPYRRMYAGFIATGYGLDITEAEAYKALGG